MKKSSTMMSSISFKLLIYHYSMNFKLLNPKVLIHSWRYKEMKHIKDVFILLQRLLKMLWKNYHKKENLIVLSVLIYLQSLAICRAVIDFVFNVWESIQTIRINARCVILKFQHIFRFSIIMMIQKSFCIRCSKERCHVDISRKFITF